MLELGLLEVQPFKVILVGPGCYVFWFVCCAKGELSLCRDIDWFVQNSGCLNKKLKQVESQCYMVKMSIINIWYNDKNNDIHTRDYKFEIQMEVFMDI